MSTEVFLRTFIPLLVAVDPFGVVPVYISITSALPKSRHRALAFQSVGVAFVVALGFTLIGEGLFRILGIRVYDFQIAGGILLLVLAVLDLLTAGKPAVNESATVGIVPLAMPLIAGPATLTTSLMLSRTYGYGPTVLSLALNFFLLLLILRAAGWLTRLFGVAALTAFSKLVMLLLAAIAVNFIRVGIAQMVAEIAHRVATS